MTTQDKLADALRNLVDMLREHPAMQGREHIHLGIAANNALREHDVSLAAAPQPTPDKCFCDRMYPDSNPNASCGDCPTRDYAPKPPSIPEPSEADVELAWSTLRSTTQPRDSCACDGDMRAVLSGFAARLRERGGK